MLLLCMICSEDVIKHDNVPYVTNCGHVFHYPCLTQWLERSKTCPQCRHKCNERSIFRIYLNVNTNEVNTSIPSLDLDSLQHDNDSLRLIIREKDMMIKQKEEKSEDFTKTIAGLKTDLKKSSAEILYVQRKLDDNKILMKTYTDQIKNINEKYKEMDKIKDELEQSKKKIAELELAQFVMDASVNEVENTLKENIPRESLIVMVSSLKRELRNSENRREKLLITIKQNKNYLNSCLLKQKIVTEENQELESENYKLKEKLSSLVNGKGPIDRQIHQDRRCDSATAAASLLNLKETERNVSISKKITDSPYLNIVSSSIGLSPLMPHDDARKRIRTHTEHTVDNEISIIKKPRQGMMTALMARSYTISNPFGSFNKSSSSSSSSNGLFPTSSLSNFTTTTTTTTSNGSENSTSNRLKKGKLKNFIKYPSVEL